MIVQVCLEFCRIYLLLNRNFRSTMLEAGIISFRLKNIIMQLPLVTLSCSSVFMP